MWRGHFGWKYFKDKEKMERLKDHLTFIVVVIIPLIAMLLWSGLAPIP